MYDESIHKAANTAILNQVGQPPPSVVLAALVELLGGNPDEVAVDIEWGDGHTVWHVYAISGDIFTNVRAIKQVDDWYGGTMRQHDDPQPDVLAVARRISDIRSLTASGIKANQPIQGFADVRRAKWAVHFADEVVHLDDSGRYGDGVTRLALALRRRFLGIQDNAES